MMNSRAQHEFDVLCPTPRGTLIASTANRLSVRLPWLSCPYKNAATGVN
jgi:hypothetical protein